MFIKKKERDDRCGEGRVGTGVEREGQTEGKSKRQSVTGA